MLNDLRFAFRMLTVRPWFSAIVVLTLALGIGINTTVFTLANAVLLKPVPVPNGGRLVCVMEQSLKDPRLKRWVSLPAYRDFRAQARTLSGLEAADQVQGSISENGLPAERYQLGEVSPGLFAMLQIWPVLGRPFTDADGVRGAAPVVMLGYGMWQSRYGGTADVIGRVVHVNGKAATIVGVMPEGFQFPNTQEFWMPLQPSPASEDRSGGGLMMVGLIRPGLDQAAVQADLARIAAGLARLHPDTEKDLTAQVLTFHEAFNGGPIRLIFMLMLGAVGFVLLIACANVANMMLSLSQVRSREIAVRVAVGASRGQIIRQLLVESMTLSVLGGLAGLLLSLFGVRAFDLACQDVGKPYWIQFTMDWVAFGYFALVSLGTGVVFGLVPALRTSRVDLNTALKEGTVGGSPGAGRLSGALVVVQFALTVVLLAGAGVMIRGFVEAQGINAAVPAAHLLTARVSLPDGKGERYETEEARRRMHDRILETLVTLPGVTGAALTSDMPGLGSQTRDIEVEGRPDPDPKQRPRAAAVFASARYPALVGLPLLTGRFLNETDGLPGREAAVVTRVFAAHFWPGASPLGGRFRFHQDGKPGAWITVAGVCGDLDQNPMDTVPAPLAFMSDRQEPWAWLGLLVRTDRDPAAVASAVRDGVRRIDPDLPVFEVRTLPEALAHQFWFLRVFGSLFLVFSLIGLAMASVGIYAVVAQATARRTREIGIRMALGATAGSVVALVVSRGFRQLGVGLLVGLAGAVVASRLMQGLPAVGSGHDPLIFSCSILLLLLVGLFACWLPARRAASIPPTEALRAE